MNNHPEIPKGIYCYNYINNKRTLCPHWKRIEGGARCELLKQDSTNEDFHNLIWDQVKECEINED